MSKTIEQIRQELDSNIPRDVISERDAGFGGKKLSYLEGWYVIDRLNKVFGQGNWSYSLGDLIKTFEGEVNGRNYVSYIAKVQLSLAVPNSTDITVFTDVGFGDGQDKSNPGKAHELAVKEAVTDGIKRCAKSLGMSMGLALYDKTQEFVDDAKPTESKQNAATADAKDVRESKATGKTPAKKADVKKAVVREIALRLRDLNKLTLQDFKDKFLISFAPAVGANIKIDDLTEQQAETLYTTLKQEYPDVV